MHRGGRAHGAGRVAHRTAFWRHAPRKPACCDEQAAAVNKTHRLLPLHLAGRHARHPALPVETPRCASARPSPPTSWAKKLKALVVTFKPAVEDAWQTDLESSCGLRWRWQYLSRASGRRPRRKSIDKRKPVVYFGSFQDLLQRDAAGQHQTPQRVAARWCTGTWWCSTNTTSARRESAKELFEGDEERIERAETRVDDTKGQKERIADPQEPLERESDFLPITTRGVSEIPGQSLFKALANGEFIEEQIFNWTYTDEQRAKAAFANRHPGQRNPMRRCRCGC